MGTPGREADRGTLTARKNFELMKLKIFATALAVLCQPALNPSARAQHTQPEKISQDKSQMKTSTQTNEPAHAVATTSERIKQPNVQGRRLSPEDVRKVAPALEHYTQDILYA